MKDYKVFIINGYCPKCGSELKNSEHNILYCIWCKCYIPSIGKGVEVSAEENKEYWECFNSAFKNTIKSIQQNGVDQTLKP